MKMKEAGVGVGGRYGGDFLMNQSKYIISNNTILESIVSVSDPPL